MKHSSLKSVGSRPFWQSKFSESVAQALNPIPLSLVGKTITTVTGWKVQGNITCYPFGCHKVLPAIIPCCWSLWPGTRQGDMNHWHSAVFNCVAVDKSLSDNKTIKQWWNLHPRLAWLESMPWLESLPYMASNTLQWLWGVYEPCRSCKRWLKLMTNK